jgi:hypothetical protein
LLSRHEQRGLSLDAYLQTVIEDLASKERAPAISLGELSKKLDLLAQMGRDLPPLPLEALSRETIYQDRG